MGSPLYRQENHWKSLGLQLSRVKQKISRFNIENADTLCFDFEKDSLTDLHADYIFMAQLRFYFILKNLSQFC